MAVGPCELNELGKQFGRTGMNLAGVHRAQQLVEVGGEAAVRRPSRLVDLRHNDRQSVQ